jgi:hypothetical protein
MPKTPPITALENQQLQHDGVEAALSLAKQLCARSPLHAQAYDRRKAQADQFGLWPEVCYAAGLHELMTPNEFDQALCYGLVDWDC